MPPILTEEELAKYKSQSADAENKIAERDATIERLQKNDEAAQNQKRTAIIVAIILFILLLGALILAYTSPQTLGIEATRNAQKPTSSQAEKTLRSENDSLNQRIVTMQEELDQKESSVEFEEPEVYFSVQVGAFERYEVPLLSKDFLLLRGDENYYLNSYSIGVFQTLEESQKLKAALEKMGFEDVFTAKYKNAKRIDIIE